MADADGGRRGVSTLVGAETQEQIVIGQTTVTVLARGSEAEGVYSLYRLDLDPDAGGASPHYHRHFAESFLVMDGEVELYDGLDWTPRGPGTHVFIPPRGVHGYRNATSEPAALLMLSAPAVTREAYFHELAEVVAGGRELSAEEWTALYARHDQYMVDG